MRRSFSTTIAWVSLLILLWPITSAAGVTAAHDPVIIKQGDTYYLFTTGQGISVQRSRDLVAWQYAGRVFPAIPKWTFAAVPGFTGHIWAPDIALVHGQYYLYYSISTFGSNRSCIGLAVNTTLDAADPNYKWEDRGLVFESHPSDHFNAIDPNRARSDDGRDWLTFGSFWGGIQLLEIDPATGKPRATPPELVTLATRPGVEFNPIEAPFIFKRGAWYYLFVSFDFCCKGVKSNYSIVVGRAAQITGPYVDRAGQPMLQGGGTLVLQGAGDLHGPGHNAVVPDGDTTWLVHHFYNGQRAGMATLQIRPLTWDTDGWPQAGAPLE